MKQWIRWSGLVSFAVISALLVVFWLFALAPIIKWSIEYVGQELLGSKVNVAEVAVSFSPLGLTIEGLQVSDPDTPLQNIIEIANIHADLELLPLFLGKSIINEMQVSGIQIQTPRDSSGKLSKEEKEAGLGKKIKESTKSASNSAEKTLPSASEILAKETLQTEVEGEAFKQQLTDKQKAINSALEGLPNEKAAANYQAEIEQLFKGRFTSLKDFQQRQKALKDIQKRLKQEQQKLVDAKNIIASSKKDLAQQWSKLQQAPAQDYKNITSKYQLNSQGAANLSRLIFGDQIGNYADQASYWYKKAEPYIGNVKDSKEQAKEEKAEYKESITRNTGRDIFFPTDRPLPDFWIKHTVAQAILPIGEIKAVASNITHQQKVIGQPIKISFNGEKLHNMKSLNANVELNELGQDSVQTADLTMTDIAASDIDMGIQKLKISKANVQVTSKATLINGKLNATGQALFQQAKFSSSANTMVAKEMVLALAKIAQFKIEAGAKGKPLTPKVSVSSDLDSRMQSALNQRINEKQKELEQKLKQKLNEKLLSYAGDYKDQLAQLDLEQGSLGDKQKAIKELAGKQLSSFEDQQRKEADAKIAEAKRKEKAKLEAAKKKKQKELEKKAKDKLKKLF